MRRKTKVLSLPSLLVRRYQESGDTSNCEMMTVSRTFIHLKMGSLQFEGRKTEANFVDVFRPQRLHGRSIQCSSCLAP